MYHPFARSAAAAAFALATVASSAAAQITPGSQLVFTGTANATDVGTAGVVLEFARGVVADRSTNTGSFAFLNRVHGTGVSGSLADLRVGNGPQAQANLLVLGGYRFTLAFLPSGPYGQDDCYVEPRDGQECTPFQSALDEFPPSGSLSPFYLTNRGSGDPDAPFTGVAAFNLAGTVSGPSGASAAFVGTIASTFVGRSYQEVLMTLQEYGLQGLEFTGTFVAGAPLTVPGPGSGGAAETVTPEPGATALVAVGLIGLAGIVRRRV